jgi:hypothetical protein
LRWGLSNFFCPAGLEPPTSRSQPPEVVMLMGVSYHVLLFMHLFVQ